jgi:hypothetical protein
MIRNLGTARCGEGIVARDRVLAWVANEALAFAFAAGYIGSQSEKGVSALISLNLLNSRK